MANLAFKKIQGTGDYIDLEEELEISFENGKSYQIQVQNAAIICESDEKPTEEGFAIRNGEPFTYKCTGSKLWIKPSKTAIVNVAE